MDPSLQAQNPQKQSKQSRKVQYVVGVFSAVGLLLIIVACLRNGSSHSPISMNSDDFYSYSSGEENYLTNSRNGKLSGLITKDKELLQHKNEKQTKCDLNTDNVKADFAGLCQSSKRLSRPRITKNGVNSADPLGQAKNTASEWLTNKKATLDPLFKNCMTSDTLITRIQAATIFNGVAMTILEEFMNSHSATSYECKQLQKLLCRLFMEVLTDYLDALNEDSRAVESLICLAEDVVSRKMSDYECAELWGTVIMKGKNINLLAGFFDNPKCSEAMVAMSALSHFPCDLFLYNVSNLNILRNEHQGVTAELLSARSAREALKMLGELDLDISRSDAVYDYFHSIGLLFRDRTKSIVGNICPFIHGAPGRPLLQHVKDIACRRATIYPTELYHSNVRAETFLEVMQKILNCLEDEKETTGELGKWTAFIAEYERLNCGGTNS